MRSEIKGILFDKDGTLFGYEATWTVWCESVLEELSGGRSELVRRMASSSGFDVDARRFRSGSPIVNGDIDEVIALWQAEVPHLSADQINAVSVRHLENLPNAPVCDLDTVLGALIASGKVLGVATNDYEGSARAQLLTAGADGYFDFVAGFDSGHGSKPGPGMIEAFCRVHELDPASVVMVGDSTHDLHAGKAAGVGLTVGVLTGPASRDDLLADADIVMQDISELPAFLG